MNVAFLTEAAILSACQITASQKWSRLTFNDKDVYETGALNRRQIAESAEWRSAKQVERSQGSHACRECIAAMEHTQADHFQVFLIQRQRIKRLIDLSTMGWIKVSMNSQSPER